MQTVTSSRLGFVAVVAAVVLGAGGVAFAGNALATPPGAKAVTATYDDDCEQEQPDLDTVRPPKGWDDDCDEDEGHGVCPSATTTEPVEVILQHQKKPRPHETPYCPTPTATSSVPTEPPTSEPPTSVPPTSEPPTSVPPTPTDTQTVPPTPTATQTTPTATPTPCDSTSDDDDCDVITSPPDFAG